MPFNVGPIELVIVLVIALVILAPSDCPKRARPSGRPARVQGRDQRRNPGRVDRHHARTGRSAGSFANNAELLDDLRLGSVVVKAQPEDRAFAFVQVRRMPSR